LLDGTWRMGRIGRRALDRRIELPDAPVAAVRGWGLRGVA
jgi:hypothetical protein